MAESMATSLQHMVESTVAAARDEERKLEQLLFAPPTEGTVVPSIDAAKTRQFDAILVLGGGVPLSPMAEEDEGSWGDEGAPDVMMTFDGENWVPRRSSFDASSI